MGVVHIDRQNAHIAVLAVKSKVSDCGNLDIQSNHVDADPEAVDHLSGRTASCPRSVVQMLVAGVGAHLEGSSDLRFV